MPRVNRDIQRRMAARRERERRRPGGERRYRFTAPEPGLAPDETALEAEVNGQAEAVEEAPAPTRARGAREGRVAAPTTRPTARPFSAYKDEYAYVYTDLRRVGAVIGSLLLILIILYFVLPILVR
jgi:hypothetical protein